jgi:hypothetical protein
MVFFLQTLMPAQQAQLKMETWHSHTNSILVGHISLKRADEGKMPLQSFAPIFI